MTIDETRDSDALVPDAFLAVQWMRLPGGVASAAFAERVATLLHGPKIGAASVAIRETTGGRIAAEAAPKRSPLRLAWLLGVALVATAVAAFFFLRTPGAKSPTPSTVTTPLSEARQLVARARAIATQDALSREQLDAAKELCERALQLDPTDALVWAEAARTDLLFVHPYGFDRSDERRRRAQARATRAISLAPEEFEVRLVHAGVIAHAGATPALLQEAEATLRELRSIQPANREVTVQLAEVLREARRFEEAAGLFESVDEYEIAAWSYYVGGHPGLALQTVDRALAASRTPTALQLKSILLANAREDLPGAQAAIEQLRPSELLNEMPAAVAARLYLFQRNPEKVLQVIQVLPADYLDSNSFRGPRHFYAGLAEELAGRAGRAQAEWRAGLALIENRLKADPDDRDLLLWAAWLHASLDNAADAGRLLTRAQQVGGLDPTGTDDVAGRVWLRLGRDDQALDRLEQILQARKPMWETFHAEARFSPIYDRLRGNPRFEQLLRENLSEGAKPFDGDDVVGVRSGDACYEGGSEGCRAEECGAGRRRSAEQDARRKARGRRRRFGKFSADLSSPGASVS